MKKLEQFLLLLFLSLLMGCAQPTAPTPSMGKVPMGTQTVSPAEAIPATSTPKPDDNKGIVVGQLVMSGSGDILPGLPVYLGKLLPMNPGPANMVTVQEKSSPHSTSGSDGRFTISAPPGDYIFMIWTLIHSRVVINPSTNKEWEVTVKAGKTINVGKIEAEWP